MTLQTYEALTYGRDDTTQKVDQGVCPQCVQ